VFGRGRLRRLLAACKPLPACLKADVEADRRDREARAACAGVLMPGNTKTKACATCKTVKPLTEFARHARSP
jgi:hypothetical protein